MMRDLRTWLDGVNKIEQLMNRKRALGSGSFDPYEWRENFPHVSGASRELKGKVADNWRTFLDQKVSGK